MSTILGGEDIALRIKFVSVRKMKETGLAPVFTWHIRK